MRWCKCVAKYYQNLLQQPSSSLLSADGKRVENVGSGVRGERDGFAPVFTRCVSCQEGRNRRRKECSIWRKKQREVKAQAHQHTTGVTASKNGSKTSTKTGRITRGTPTAVLHLLPLDVLLVELRQEPLPVLVLEVGVLSQLSADHERLDVVHRVHVVHAVRNDLSHLLQTLHGSWPTTGTQKQLMIRKRS